MKLAKGRALFLSIRIFKSRLTGLFLCALLGAGLCAGGEREARAIDDELVARHMPFGTVVDPVYASPVSDVITSYSRGGDSALWTAFYLAAEAFRWHATRDPEALKRAGMAMAGLEELVNVTGTDTLARVAVPAAAESAAGMLREEEHNGVYPGRLDGAAWKWVGGTSRDQYLGVFFGLEAASEMLDDAALRERARRLCARLMRRLLRDGWKIRMPDGGSRTTFEFQPDEQLALLAVARRLKPDEFSGAYAQSAWMAPLVTAGVVTKALDRHHNYYKFQLAAIDLYDLIRLEDSPARRACYRAAFRAVAWAVPAEGNPFFAMLERAVDGPTAERDARAQRDLDAWLDRPRRDFPVDLRGSWAVCGSAGEACAMVPIGERVPTDFLWQRSPYQSWGGGEGTIEGAGIDYLLPYWMGRNFPGK